MKVAIWGAGQLSKKIIHEIIDDYEVIFIIDSDDSKEGSVCEGYPVLSIRNAVKRKSEIDGILIGVRALFEQKRIALKLKAFQVRKLYYVLEQRIQ